MLTQRRDGAVLRQIDLLFDVGTMGDLTDGQLLERFATDAGESAESAFGELVNRHGPLVLRTCESILHDEHAAEDAFQATFMVLVSKARSLYVQDSLGPWLHQVACRTASCARSCIARRIKHEKRWAGMVSARGARNLTASGDDLPAVLHQELNRLSEKFRAPVVLCDLEGRTHEQAARHLGWPTGTLKTRLTRGRSVLRERLARRGIGLSVALAAVESLTDHARAAIPPALARNTVASMTWILGGQMGGLVLSDHVRALAQGALRQMQFAMVKSLAIAAVLVGLGTVGAYSQRRPVQAAGEGQVPPARSGTAPLNSVHQLDEELRRTLNDAVLAAKTISDPAARRSALVRIGNAQHALGDRQSATTTLLLAHASAEKITSEMERQFGLWRVARMQAQIGDLASARTTFDQFSRIAETRSPGGRVELLSYIAQAQAQAGLRGDAMATIKKASSAVPLIEGESLRNHGLFQVLHAQMLAGDFDGALASAESLKDKQSPHRASFLEYIAGNCDSAGRDRAKTILTRALSLSKGVIYPYPRAMAQSSIAKALARNGDITAALATARAIGQPEPEEDNPGPFGNLFGARNRARRLADQRILADAAQTEIAPALIEIASEQAKGGDRPKSKATFREAFELIVNSRDGVIKTQSLRILVEALSAVGEIQAAKEAIKAIQADNASKALALVALARAQAKAGDRSAARDRLREARAEAAGVGQLPNLINDDPGRRKDEAFQAIGDAQAELGEIEDAMATVASHGTESWKGAIAAQIAPAQARSGDFAAAVKTAEAIRDDGQKAEAFLRIAHVQAERGKQSDAVAWAAKLSSPQAKALALLGSVEGSISARKAATSK
jgi:RNA polymerase sigma factor (sigma-70 family)